MKQAVIRLTLPGVLIRLAISRFVKKLVWRLAGEAGHIASASRDAGIQLARSRDETGQRSPEFGYSYGSSRDFQINPESNIEDRRKELQESNRLLEREVAERENREEELRESEERFRQMAEHIREVFFLVDFREKRMLYVSPAVEEIWGQPRERFYENPTLMFDPVHPDDRAYIEEALAQQQITGEFNEEFRIIRPDGSVRWILDRVVPIQNDSGEVYRLVGIVEDITERKRAEEHVQETARLASIGELAAGVAHEVNNPLTAVLGYSQLVLAEDLPSSVRVDVQTIHSEAQRAAKIVQNLLSYARKSGSDRIYINVNSVLERALELKSYDLKTSGIVVICDFSEDLPSTMIDEHQMVQVFVNILTNAQQAFGSIDANAQITLGSFESGGRIRITISDNGPGISVEHQAKIFAPFFTTKDVGTGTGLGLSICYGIIRQHGGEIWADSIQGEGVTFHIELPILAPQVELDFFSQPSSPKLTSTRHILVVDDEPHIRNLLRRSLESERYTVDLANDGEEAWGKLGNLRYDCILLDLKMPRMSGRELYQLIHQTDEALSRKVIFISGDTVNQATHKFISRTGKPLVTKPFQLEELRSHIANLVEEP